MENNTQIPYSDTPADLRSPSPVSSDPSATLKPLPALPAQAPAYTEVAPYRDEPSVTESHPARGHRPSLSLHLPHYQHHQIAYRPYTDLPSPSEAPSPSSTIDDDDVPLAHLLLQSQAYPHPQAYSIEVSYPLEAPPSYSVAVRQSYRDTLVLHIPRGPPNQHQVDEESGVELARADDVRHSVEKVVAMFVVASLLLIISAVFGWLALGSGMWT
ncbi:hypothetical protein BKA66DRAFT_507044 [Pyrenochaeta sp. MPI-SDFR-AT-0127]|nr:hypothetical protein BKA66DRAFT_507044 [Pyrenochaeta sp. MPI-SDFR-AT-0127]